MKKAITFLIGITLIIIALNQTDNGGYQNPGKKALVSTHRAG